MMIYMDYDIVDNLLIILLCLLSSSGRIIMEDLMGVLTFSLRVAWIYSVLSLMEEKKIDKMIDFAKTELLHRFIMTFMVSLTLVLCNDV